MKIINNNLDQLLQLAEEATQKKNWSLAIKRWQKIINQFKDHAPSDAWLWLARGYININETDRAEQIAAEGLNKHPNSTRLLILAGKIASANEDWSRSEELWTRVIENLAEKAPSIAWANLAESQRLLGKLEQSKKSAEQGLINYSGNLEILIELAEVTTAEKDWRTALDFWVKALSVVNKQDVPNIPTKQHIRFNVSILKRLVNINDYKNEVKKYSQSKQKRSIAIVTSVTKGYDAIKPPEVLDNRFDYIVYTNDTVDELGIFKVYPLPKPELDDGRAIRYVKTHPHVLLSNYDAVVWVDSSLMIVGDIYPLIKQFLDSNKAIGSGVHPLRKNIYEEFEANVRLNKENYKIMKKQVDFYKSQGFEHSDLAENTMLMFNIGHPKLAPALETWWDQICKFSRRDQLSFNYSLAKNSAEWHKLTKSPQHIRNHPDFIWMPHKSEQKILTELTNQLKS